MKLTDFCILFAALAVCLFLGRDLHIRALLAQSVSEISYNRQMDRIDEDALMDLVETACEDGTLSLRTEKLQEQFERLMALAFDLTDDACKQRAREAVTLFSFRQYPYDLSDADLSRIIEDMETQANEAKQRRRKVQHFKIAMPYCAHDAWYQTLSGPQLFSVFDPREPLWGQERAVPGGSRIVKLNRPADENFPL